MIEASLLQADDLPALAAMWTQALQRAGSDCPLSASEIETGVLLHGGEPRAILAIDPRGWLVARSNGELIGFAHCTVGRLMADDAEILRGFLRALVLAPNAPAATTGVLLRAADGYFRAQNNLRNIIAFHLHTGYPRVLYGRGTVMHEQWALMDALGNAAYRLTMRWLFFERRLTTRIPEHPPQLPKLALQWEDSMAEELSLAAWSGHDMIARAQFMILPQPSGCTAPNAASLFNLEVAAEIRGQGAGGWLLERAANQLIAQGVTYLLGDAPHEDIGAQSRLRHLHFHECPLRGYTYEKSHA